MVKLRDLVFIKALLPIRLFGGGSTGSGAGDMTGLPYFIAGNQQMLNDQAGNTALAIDTAAVRQMDLQRQIAQEQQGLAKQGVAYESGVNRYNQYNPYGSVTWQNVGTETNPQYQQTTTLTPEQQNILNARQYAQQQATSGAGTQANRAVGNLENNYDYGTQSQQALNNFGVMSGGDLGTRQYVENQLLDRLNPSLQQDEERLRTRLANQGLQYGTEAYGNAMRDYNQRVNDARLAVTNYGGQEMQRSQQMEQARQNQYFQNMGASQNLLYGQQNQGLNALNALLGASGQTQMPTYTGATGVQSAASTVPNLQVPNIGQMIYGANQLQNDRAIANAAGLQGWSKELTAQAVQNNQMSQQAKNSGLSGGLGMLGTLGGAYLGSPALGGMIGSSIGSGIGGGGGY